MTTPLGFGALSQRRLLCVLSASLLSVTAQAATLTRDNGAAVGDNQNSQTAGANGPVLLQDVQLLQSCSVLIASVSRSELFTLVAQAHTARLQSPMT